MATSLSGIKGFAGGKGQIDPIDMAALVGIPWFAATIFGVFDFTVNVFGGYDFTSPLWTVGGADISVALLAIVFLTVWVFATNELTSSDYDPAVGALMAFALLSPLLFVFVPAFESLVTWSDLTRLAFTLGVSVATTAVSYLN